jgi:hypothetical protein
VVLPESWLTNPTRFRLSCLHELQHHRQGDTRAIFLLEFARMLFFWNPAAHAWIRSISQLQEFACDEALIDRRDVSPRAYGGCLLQAAELTLGNHRLPAGTAGMAVSPSGRLLKRRIKMILDPIETKGRSWSALAAGTVALALMGGLAFAEQGVIRDRRISMEQAQRWARSAAAGSDFPIVVNERVLEVLNLALGTPDGRTQVKEALERMVNYRSMIDAKIREYHYPSELLAVALAESRFQNDSRRGSAGLWRFIEATARHYNLRVDDQVDERLDAEKETDAAMRYLGANYLRFQDWQLAVLAYNVGESHLQNAIDETGSRDAWKLIEAGTENDAGYLAKVMAAVIILKNPEILH